MPALAQPSSSNQGTPALAAYEALAPFYDDFTAGYAHEAWLEELLALLHGVGFEGRRVLDVACGTGKSTLPLLGRGYDVTACDISPAMVEIARRRLRLRDGRVFVADMRRLPELPGFDLVTCLDDAVNYLLTEADLEASLASMSRALRPGGLLLFDANSLATFQDVFQADVVREADGTRFHWRGSRSGPAAAGGLFTATIDVARRDGPEGQPPIARSVHVERHHHRESLVGCLERAGLRPVAVVGQSEGGRLSEHADETRHSKLVYVARRDA